MDKQLFKITERENFLDEKERELLKKIKVAIVGLGSLGTHVADQLARLGVKNLLLIDYDIVEEHNLRRQTLYTLNDVGKRKAVAVKEHLKDIVKDVKVDARVLVLNSKTILEVLKDVDFVFDCTDSISTRLLINDFCMKENKPWVHGAVIHDEGEVQLIVPPKTSCYQCFIGRKASYEVCDEGNVLLPAISIVASLQVNLFLKYYFGEYEEDVVYRIKLFNNGPKLYSLKVKKSDTCKACQGDFIYLNESQEFIISLCKRRAALRVLPRRNLKVEKEALEKLFRVEMETPVAFLVSYDNIEFLVYKQGELVFRENIAIDKINQIAKKFYDTLLNEEK